jgi:hypothetical protein
MSKLVSATAVGFGDYLDVLPDAWDIADELCNATHGCNSQTGTGDPNDPGDVRGPTDVGPGQPDNSGIQPGTVVG